MVVPNLAKAKARHMDNCKLQGDYYGYSKLIKFSYNTTLVKSLPHVKIKGEVMKKGEIKQIIRTSIVRYIRVSKVKR